MPFSIVNSTMGFYSALFFKKRRTIGALQRARERRTGGVGELEKKMAVLANGNSIITFKKNKPWGNRVF